METMTTEIDVLRFCGDVRIEEGAVVGQVFRMSGKPVAGGARRSIEVPRGLVGDLADRRLIAWSHDRGARLPVGVLIALTRAGRNRLSKEAAPAG